MARARIPFLGFLAFAGCGLGTIDVKDTSPADTDADTDSDADADADSDADADADTDTDTDTDTFDLEFAPVSGVSVEVNPRVVTVLEVSWTQDQAVDAGWLEFSFEDDAWHRSPAVVREAGPQSELILGVPGSTDVRFRIVNQVGDHEVASEEEYEGRTGVVPLALPEPASVEWDPELTHPSPFILGSINQEEGGWAGGTYWAFVMDRQGRMVWYWEAPNQHWVLYPRVAHSGDHLVLDESTYWCCASAEDSIINRFTITGDKLEVIDAPGLHHSWAQTPEGVLYWGAVGGGDEVMRRYDPSTGVQEDIWSCEDWLDSVGGSDPWCESNTVNYVEAHHTVLFSFYTNGSVVEIDADSGTLVRQFGEMPGSYSFDPPDSQFTWQHGVNYTPDGHLLLSTHPLDWSDATQYARQYTVDDGSSTLEQNWYYASTDKFANTAGEVYLLDNGNYMINYGSSAGVREILADGTIVYDADWERGYLLGHTSLIDDLYALKGPAE